MTLYKRTANGRIAMTPEEEAQFEADRAYVSPDMVRQQRDQTLASEVDPLVSNPLRWGSMTETEQAAWTNYRQKLLDLPEQEGFPNTVTWPTAPV
jgi:hypothetical protein